jgi:F-type H+-transporting ATPase subunit a
MPEHTSFLTFLLAKMRDTLEQNASVIGNTFVNHDPPNWRSFEPITASLIVVVMVILIGLSVRARLSDTDKAVVPDDKLTLRTFMEAFLGFFYDLAKEMMGPERAKKYFPLVGTSATFVFFANVLAIVPGLPVATTSFNITLGSAFVVFILFNVYGFATNGLRYMGHLAGPVWWLWWLIFPIELISLCVRPLTLGVRLMLNMAVDHLLVTIFSGLVVLVVPLPVMALTFLVVIIQTLVFALLTCIYIALATEHEEHEHA